MIYFDNAATSYPKPPFVMDAMAAAMRDAGGNPGRSSHRLSAAAAELCYRVRTEIAEFCHFPYPENVVFTKNATEALNLAIKCNVKAGMHILIGNREHNAVFRPVYRLQSDGIAHYSIFDAQKPPEETLPPLLTPETKMLVLCSVSNVSGEVADIESYVRFAKSHGIYTIIDLSQHLGHIPFDYRKFPADAVAAPAHKGLYGIPGLGFVYFHDPIALTTLLEGGSGSASKNPEMPKLLPDRLEAGTLPVPAIAALSAGLRFVTEITPEGIMEYETRLLRRARTMLSELPSIRLYGNGEMHGLLSFTHRDKSPNELSDALDVRQIAVRSGYHCAPLAHAAIGSPEGGTVRLSFGIHNTERELEQFYKVIKSIV